MNADKSLSGHVADVEPLQEHGISMLDASLIDYECKCKKSTSDTITIKLDESSNTIFIRCLVCDRENFVAFNPKNCKCNDSTGHNIIFDELGFVLKVECVVCHATVDCRVDRKVDVTTCATGDGTPMGRTNIRSFTELKTGDHIAWHQRLAYWHHAIVVDVRDDKIQVINYDGPVGTASKGEIVKEWNDSCDQLYRIDYCPKDCNHPDTVVERAHSKIGERSYNLLTNNCEHFARWCKTGHKRSLQAESFGRSIWKRLVLLADISRSKRGQAAIKHGMKALRSSSSAVTSKRASNLLTPALVIGHEVKFVISDLVNAHKQRQMGCITRDEFIKITIKRVSEGCASIAGITFALVIPVMSNGAGCTVAAMIGQGIGAVVGRQLCGIYDHKVQNKTQ
jgi:hypothetical protein